MGAPFAAFALDEGAQSLASLDVEETQVLLHDWNLHKAFGAEFLEMEFDGRFLSVLDTTNYHADKLHFPRATLEHWEILLREINLRKSGHFLGRRLNDLD